MEVFAWDTNKFIISDIKDGEDLVNGKISLYVGTKYPIKKEVDVVDGKAEIKINGIESNQKSGEYNMDITLHIWKEKTTLTTDKFIIKNKM